VRRPRRLAARAGAASAALAAALLGVAGVAGASSPTSVAPPSTSPSTSTSTTLAPARCDPVAPVAVEFVGTVVRVDETAVRLRVGEVQVGAPLGAAEIDVTYVRDARFLRVGSVYRVVAARDAESGAYVSKVRSLRGTDPRCVALDPIVTTLADRTPIDTGVFSGLDGTRNRALRAVLLPLAAAVGLLLALVIVKWAAIFAARGVRRLVRGPART
jgi:hypothetical protein